MVVSAAKPLPFQVDGDYLGDRMRVEVACLPHALRVIA
jgi:diacylglycerol kinase family enzyme